MTALMQRTPFHLRTTKALTKSRLDRDNAESIAFYNGETREVGVASRCLRNLIYVGRLRMKWSAYLSLWTNCYSYATILAPAVITAPMYFRGQIEFGIISQVCPQLVVQTSHIMTDSIQTSHRHCADAP